MNLCEKRFWEENWKEIDNQGMGDIVKCWKWYEREASDRTR